jgi:hypothetical protein
MRCISHRCRGSVCGLDRACEAVALRLADQFPIDAIPTGLVGPVPQQRRRRCAFILVRGTGSMQERGV